MRLILGFTTGVLVTLIAATNLTPQQTQYQTITHTDTILEVDYFRMLDTFQDDRSIDPNLDDRLYVECVQVIERHTDEPLMGIILHLERHWQSDACAAADHLATHGYW